MTKLTCLVIAAALVGCRDKAKDQPSATRPSAQPAAAAGDSKWVAKLPELATGSTKLQLNRTVALVALRADGSIHVASPPPAGAVGDPFAAAKPAQLADLANTLGLPPVAARSDSAFAALDGSGDVQSANPTDALFAALGHPVPASGAPKPPPRATNAFAIYHEHPVSAGVVVFADAQAPAATLVDMLAQTGGFVAVRRGSELAALPLAFDRQAPARVSPDKRWVEVRLGKEIVVEVVPSTPVPIASIDRLGEAASTTKPIAVDVLVGADTKVKELIDAIAQLRVAKVGAIGLGRVPAAGTDALAARGTPAARVLAWDFFMTDMDKTDATPFRSALDAALEPTRACFTTALGKQPKLAGATQLELFVVPKGKVAAVEAKGLDAALAKCLTTAVRSSMFPPVGGGGVKIVARVAFVPPS